jgi:hypothetical protein
MKKRGKTAGVEAEEPGSSPELHTPATAAADLGQRLGPSPSSADPIRLYQIEVKAQGSHIARHLISAGNALDAINLVESEYGEPVEIESILIEKEDGSQHPLMTIKNWHGYTFDARVIEL